MREIKQPNFVVFDLDNTLYDYEKSNQFASTGLFQLISNDYSIDIPTIFTAFSQARNSVKQRLGSSASSHSRLLYISEAFRMLDIKPNALSLIKYEDLFWNLYLEKMELFPEAKELLNAIEDRGIPMAIVTDLTLYIQLRKLSRLGLHDKFDLIISSEDAGGNKSSGLPFLLLMNYVKQAPVHIWYFGDSIHDYPESESTKLTFFHKVEKLKNSSESHVIEFQDYQALKNMLKDERRQTPSFDW
jgi:putative hydrolase of the HAD superfamily